MGAAAGSEPRREREEVINEKDAPTVEKRTCVTHADGTRVARKSRVSGRLPNQRLVAGDKPETPSHDPARKIGSSVSWGTFSGASPENSSYVATQVIRGDYFFSSVTLVTEPHKLRELFGAS
jgi:hypothetical protein